MSNPNNRDIFYVGLTLLQNKIVNSGQNREKHPFGEVRVNKCRRNQKGVYCGKKKLHWIKFLYTFCLHTLHIKEHKMDRPRKKHIITYLKIQRIDFGIPTASWKWEKKSRKKLRDKGGTPECAFKHSSSHWLVPKVCMHW